MKDFSELQENLAIITGQAPHMIYSKTSVSNFKLREGMPVMLRVTLR
jgi:large subunit ribosomal protein L5